ncbi:MAG: ABC transporter substrate-binding protein [Candidatus Treponema excrementipullorum]|nr:ABC transporter substrate-binding protein [Candidatus Treponema excrementipullorum]
MKKILLSITALLLVGSMVFVGCKKHAPKEEVVEFYHGFYHAESEWPPAKAMRDIYDAFAARYADGPVKFKPIPVENRYDITMAAVAGGNFPDIVDIGQPVPPSAISQGLVMDLKPYIDANGLQDAVGINYDQNIVNGKLYTVHDQLESRGTWYNTAILERAGVDIASMNTWEGFAAAMEKVRALNDGSYGYIAGQGSVMILNSKLATTAEGRALLNGALTKDGINSVAFKNAFIETAKLDQANGSAHTTVDIGNMMADFNTNGIVAVLHNGVWNAGSIDTSLKDAIEPAIFPGSVSISTASGGITIANNMSDAKKEVALEFLKYMVSPEVQEKIFLQVQAAPCNETVDVNALASTSSDVATKKLAAAIGMVADADNIVICLSTPWGQDVQTAIINALTECAVAGADIEGRFARLQQELIAIVG